MENVKGTYSVWIHECRKQKSWQRGKGIERCGAESTLYNEPGPGKLEKERHDLTPNAKKATHVQLSEKLGKEAK